MLNFVNSLSFIKFTFYLTKMFAKTLISNFIDKPNILIFFYLIDKLCNWIKSWIIFIIKSTYSFVVLLIAPVTIIFYFYRKQYISSFNLYFCWIVDWKLSFRFRKLLNCNFLSQHFFVVAIFLNIINFCKPN